VRPLGLFRQSTASLREVGVFAQEEARGSSTTTSAPSTSCPACSARRRDRRGGAGIAPSHGRALEVVGSNYCALVTGELAEAIEQGMRLIGFARSSRMPRVSTGVAGVVVLLALLVPAGCGSSSASHTSLTDHPSLSKRASSAPSRGGRHVLLRHLLNPQAYAAGGELYVAQQVTPAGDRVLSELMRVDPISGRVDAVRRLGSAFDQALLDDGVLWVSTTRAQTSWLWRLDPASLDVRSREVLPGSVPDDGTVGALAVAGGWLWGGNADRLDRVSLASGEVTAALPIPRAGGIDVAADPSGRVLLVSEGQELARLQRRDPHTGALIASSPIFEGVTKPYLGGIIDGGAWISEATGMMGYAERVHVDDLATARYPSISWAAKGGVSPLVNATNGIRAVVRDGILWVTQVAGGPQRNYCGNPVSGQPRAALGLPAQSWLLAVAPTSFYYVNGGATGTLGELVRAPIPPACGAAALAHDGTGFSQGSRANAG